MSALRTRAHARHAKPVRGRKAVSTGVTASAALLSLTTLHATHAAFTSQTSAPAQSIDSATVAVGLTGPSGQTTTLSLLNAQPDTTVVRPVDVANNGTIELQYAVSTQVADGSTALAEELVWTVKSGVTDCSPAGFGGSGSTLYDGQLATSAKTPRIGSPVSGAHVGDRVLAVGATEQLCMRLTLPLSASNATQGVTSNVTVHFDAEQTRNV